MMHRRRWLVGGMLLAALLAGRRLLRDRRTLRVSQAPTRIDIQATPIASFDNRDPSITRFGALEFRGGLVLTSKYAAFGGISAINVEPDGAHFLAITDRGSWLRGRIVYEDGKPAGIADAEMAPILGADGKPLAARGWFDVESLTELDGMHYIGIERVEQIVRLIIAATVFWRAANRSRCRPTSRPSPSTRAWNAWPRRRRIHRSPASSSSSPSAASMARAIIARS